MNGSTPAPSDPAGRPALEIGEDPAFQQRTWAVQRIGWVLMLLLVVAAIAGLFSVGPLSTAQVGDPEGLITVEYDRFARYLAPTTLRLRLHPPATGRGEVAVRLNRALAVGLEIQHVSPRAERMMAASDGMRLAFLVAELGQSADIAFTVKPQRIGFLRGELGLVGHAPARLNQFVYP